MIIWFSVRFNKVYDDLRGISPDSVQDGCEYGESEVVLSLPDNYSETGAPVPLIFSAHGSGGRVSRADDKTGGLNYLAPLLENGYAAFDLHGTRADGRSYGNRRYTEAVRRAYRYILSHYNVEPGLFVAGASMGGLSALNYVNLFPEDVRVIGLFYPRTNLHAETVDGVTYNGPWERDIKSFDVKQTIAEEFGFAGREEFDEEKTVGLNPWYNRTVTFDGVRYSSLPCAVKIWHGNADGTVAYPLSVEYVAGLRRGGCYAVLRTLDGVGHKHNEVMRRELLLWFDRFR